MIRKRLTRHLLSAFALLLLLLPACRSSKSSAPQTREKSVVVGSKRGPKKLNPTVGGRLVEEAYTWLGTPYIYAGSTKGEGTDCSGMVMQVYMDVAGCMLPRNSAKQAEFCQPLDASQISQGDLVFFATGQDPEKVSHVGILIDEVSFIHASSKKGVVISRLDTPYYQRTLRGFGRVPM